MRHSPPIIDYTVRVISVILAQEYMQANRAKTLARVWPFDVVSQDVWLILIDQILELLYSVEVIGRINGTVHITYRLPCNGGSAAPANQSKPPE